ncbi:cell division protein FtsQ/DivIB [Sessilibacter corallicola]|uniref:Cell division protein FtsQ n=1 Tax=Sessilibacter corallicola TaxID=2904075 RepID=A0ABQ0A3Q4_9GAMM
MTAAFLFRANRLNGQLVAKSTKRGASSTKRKPKGKSDKTPGKQRVLSWIIAFSVLSMLAVGAVLLGVLARQKTLEVVDRSVSAVIVDGDLEQVSLERFESLVEPLVDKSFLGLDLNRLKRQLESDPWIAQATLNRQWPDKLKVTLVEETAIARWGNDSFLNQAGKRIDIGRNNFLTQLPGLNGPEGTEIKVTEQFMSFSSQLRLHGLDPVWLTLGDDYSWTLGLDNKISVILGKNNIEDKLERFVVVYEKHLIDEANNIESVDLRYRNGVAVNWKNISVKKQNTQPLNQ